MKHYLISITGKMGTGKSTICNLITPKVDFDCRLVKFAQPLYDMQSAVYGVLGKPVPGGKDRKLLQLLGTEWGRQTQGESVWVDKFDATVHEKWEAGVRFILNDDCRFDNEAARVKAMGGVIIRVVADDVIRAERIELKETTHPSEKGVSLSYVDYTIVNNGSMSFLGMQVEAILNEITEKHDVVSRTRSGAA